MLGVSATAKGADIRAAMANVRLERVNMRENSIGYKFEGAHYNRNDNDYQIDYHLGLAQKKTPA